MWHVYGSTLFMCNTYIYSRKVTGGVRFMFLSNQFKFLLICYPIHILRNITKTFYTAQTYFCFCCPMRYDFYTDKRTATQKRKRVCFELKHETGCFRKDCNERDSFSISRVLFLLILVRRKLDIASVRTSICTLFGGCWKMCILSLEICECVTVETCILLVHWNGEARVELLHYFNLLKPIMNQLHSSGHSFCDISELMFVKIYFKG